MENKDLNNDSICDEMQDEMQDETRELTDKMIRDYSYYQQTDCPLPLIEQVQHEIAEKLDIMFYPENKGSINQLLFKNELMFLQNGIILFGRFNIIVTGTGVYMKVLTPLDMFWMDIFGKIHDNIKIITAIIAPYIEMLSRYANTDSVPYNEIDNVYNAIYAMEIGDKELEFVIPINGKVPEIVDVWKDLTCLLKIKRETRNSFKYTVAYKKYSKDVPEVLKEDTLPMGSLRNFLNMLYYNGEFGSRPDYSANKM